MKTQGDPVSRVIGPDNLKDIAQARKDIPADKCVPPLPKCCVCTLHVLWLNVCDIVLVEFALFSAACLHWLHASGQGQANIYVVMYQAQRASNIAA